MKKINFINIKLWAIALFGILNMMISFEPVVATETHGLCLGAGGQLEHCCITCQTENCGCEENNQ